MSRFNQKTLIILISLLLLVIALGIISFAGIEVSFLNWIEKGIYNFITPIIEYITGFFNMAGNYWSNIMNIDQLIEENKMLREKISEYEIQNNMNEYYKLENIRLRKLLSFKKQISFDSLGARVIGHSSSHWDHRLIINRGSKDGVEERMPVITYNGALIGRINYVGAYTSQVLLINDPEFIVGGIVSRAESRAIGVIKGQLDEMHINIMDNISWNTDSAEGDIMVGDIIVTSGLSNSYPKGIPIGEVISVENDNYGISQQAEIGLFIKEQITEEVLIITKF